MRGERLRLGGRREGVRREGGVGERREAAVRGLP